MSVSVAVVVGVGLLLSATTGGSERSQHKREGCEGGGGAGWLRSWFTVRAVRRAI